MENIKIQLAAREETGKAANGRLRREGKLPVVVYGPGVEKTILGSVSTKQAEGYLTGDFKSKKFDLTLPEGTVKTCRIQSATKNFSNDKLLHIDFYAE